MRMAGDLAQTFPSELCEPIDAADYVSAVAFCPTSPHLALATDATVNVWAASAGGRRWDRELVLSAGRSTEPDDGDEVGFTAVAFSPDGRRVAAGGQSGTLRVWDLASARAILQDVAGVQINGLAFDDAGRRLGIAGDDGAARVVEAATGVVLVAVHHDEAVTAVTFSADDRRLATASVDTTARVWDSVTGTLLVELPHPSVVWDVAFSPDGTLLATAGEDKTARLWNAATGALKFELPHRRSLWGRSVTAVAFSPTGQLVASVGTDKTARLWDATTGEQRCELRHADPLSAVAFNPTGAYLATAGVGVRLWRIADDQPCPAPRSASDSAAARSSHHGDVAFPRDTHDRRSAETDPLPATAVQLETVAGVVTVIGVFLAWLLLAVDATGVDKAWTVGGAVAVGVGVLRGIFAHRRVRQAAVFPATLISRSRRGEGEGWDCEVEVTVDRGAPVRLPMHAESKRPRGGFAVVLHQGDRVLQMGDDPRRADRAELRHPVEQYGLPAMFVLGGALTAAVPFMSD